MGVAGIGFAMRRFDRPRSQRALRDLGNPFGMAHRLDPRLPASLAVIALKKKAPGLPGPGSVRG